MKAAHRIGLAVALAAAFGASAMAHAKLVGFTQPADAPGKIDLTFSEDIAGKLSGVAVTDTSGATLPASAMLDPHNAKHLAVTLRSPPKAGVYRVAWHAVASDDGHRTTGTFSFTVK
jgi:hypothetical protein